MVYVILGLLSEEIIPNRYLLCLKYIIFGKAQIKQAIINSMENKSKNDVLAKLDCAAEKAMYAESTKRRIMFI